MQSPLATTSSLPLQLLGETAVCYPEPPSVKSVHLLPSAGTVCLAAGVECVRVPGCSTNPASLLMTGTESRTKWWQSWRQEWAKVRPCPLLMHLAFLLCGQERAEPSDSVLIVHESEQLQYNCWAASCSSPAVTSCSGSTKVAATPVLLPLGSSEQEHSRANWCFCMGIYNVYTQKKIKFCCLTSSNFKMPLMSHLS